MLPRSALRAAAGRDQVLIVDEDDRLRFRDVEVVRLDGERVVIGDGLDDGERVCVSPLDVATDGMRVRTVSARLVRMIGTRAPSTMPAASAFARKVSCFARMLPASSVRDV